MRVIQQKVKIKSYFNAKSSTYYFHMKAKILEDFQICISVFDIIFSYEDKDLGRF